MDAGESHNYKDRTMTTSLKTIRANIQLWEESKQGQRPYKDEDGIIADEARERESQQWRIPPLEQATAEHTANISHQTSTLSNRHRFSIRRIKPPISANEVKQTETHNTISCIFHHCIEIEQKAQSRNTHKQADTYPYRLLEQRSIHLFHKFIKGRSKKTQSKIYSDKPIFLR